MSSHGYVAYTHGCRCDICRAAKAAYIRTRRTEARKLARAHTTGRAGTVGVQRHYVAGVKHGTSYAYYERGCRCLACTGFATNLRASLPSCTWQRGGRDASEARRVGEVDPE